MRRLPREAILGGELGAAYSPPSPFDLSLLERLRSGAAQFGTHLTSRQLEQCRWYLHLLVEWNQRFNLTAIEDPAAIIDKHFLDALSCALALDLNGVHRVVDVGTGAGFPGLVLKIAFPQLQILLLDSVEKRLRFLQRVAESLELTDTETLHARAEEAGHYHDHRQQYDLCVSRAVARLNTLVEYCLPLVRVGGRFLAQKGPDIRDELAEALPAIRKLGGSDPTVTALTLPGTDMGRTLVLITKIGPTSRDFPRLPGTPKKHPL